MEQNTIILAGLLVFSALIIGFFMFWGTRSRKEKSDSQDQLENQEIKVMESFDLDNLKNITNENIATLRLKEINNILDLKKKISSENDIINYSEIMGIRRKLVEDWVSLGEFSQLHGININHISLFEKVGILSMQDLAKQEPAFLIKLLTQNQEIPNTVPTIGMLKYWIRNSKKITAQSNEKIVTYS
jgi:hypothetical protein